MLICLKRAYLSRDGKRVVGKGSDAAASLLCGEGRLLPEGKVEGLENSSEFFRTEEESDRVARQKVHSVGFVQTSDNILSTGEVVKDEDLVKLERVIEDPPQNFDEKDLATKEK